MYRLATRFSQDSRLPDWYWTSEYETESKRTYYKVSSTHCRISLLEDSSLHWCPLSLSTTWQMHFMFGTSGHHLANSNRLNIWTSWRHSRRSGCFRCRNSYLLQIRFVLVGIVFPILRIPKTRHMIRFGSINPIVVQTQWQWMNWLLRCTKILGPEKSVLDKRVS